MTGQLPSLSFCLIGDTAIFLDLARDRYFRLAPGPNAAFVRQISGTDAGREALLAAGLEVHADAAPLTLPAPPTAGCHKPALHASFNPLRLLRTIICQRRIERHLRLRGLAAVVADLHRQLNSITLAPVIDQAGALQIVAAFEQARLVRSAVDRCLPRSIALATLLARAGYQSQVILGVKRHPFAAHCWVQSGPLVLNESPEESARYTPILIL